MNKQVLFSWSSEGLIQAKNYDICINTQNELADLQVGQSVPSSSTPIGLLSIPELNQYNGVEVYPLANSIFDSRSLRYETVNTSNVFYFKYKDFYLSHYSSTVNGIQYPLYFFHDLSSYSTIVDVTVTDLNGAEVDNLHYHFSSSEDVHSGRKGVYHNLKNTFDPNGSSIYLVTFTDSEGVHRQDLLESSPIFTEGGADPFGYSIVECYDDTDARSYQVTINYPSGSISATTPIWSIADETSVAQLENYFNYSDRPWYIDIADGSTIHTIKNNANSPIFEADDKYYYIKLTEDNYTLHENWTDANLTGWSAGGTQILINNEYVVEISATAISYHLGSIAPGEYNWWTNLKTSSTNNYTITFSDGSVIYDEVTGSAMTGWTGVGQPFNIVTPTVDLVLTLEQDDPAETVRFKTFKFTNLSLDSECRSGLGTLETTNTFQTIDSYDIDSATLYIEDGVLFVDDTPPGSVYPLTFLSNKNVPIKVTYNGGLRVTTSEITQRDTEVSFTLPEIVGEEATEEEELVYINEHLLYFPRGIIKTDSTIDVIVKDINGVPVRVFTTSTSSYIERYVDYKGYTYDIKKEHNLIESVSETTGFILLQASLFPRNRYYISCHYNADKVHYTDINFNSISNPGIENKKVVFYIKGLPDSVVDWRGSRAIEHIVIDSQGRIETGSEKYGFYDLLTPIHLDPAPLFGYVLDSSVTSDQVDAIELAGFVRIETISGAFDWMSFSDISNKIVIFSGGVTPIDGDLLRIMIPSANAGRTKYEMIEGECYSAAGLGLNQIYDPTLDFGFDFAGGRYLEFYDSPGAGEIYKIDNYAVSSNILTLEENITTLPEYSETSYSISKTKYRIYITYDDWKELYTIKNHRIGSSWLLDSIETNLVIPDPSRLRGGDELFINRYPIILPPDSATCIPPYTTLEIDFTGYTCPISDPSAILDKIELKLNIETTEDGVTTDKDYIATCSVWSIVAPVHTLTIAFSYTGTLNTINSIEVRYKDFPTSCVFDLGTSGTSARIYTTSHYDACDGCHLTLNQMPYAELGSVVVASPYVSTDISVKDSRRRGGGINASTFKKFSERQQDVYDFWDYKPWDGINFPAGGACYIELPIDLLDDYTSDEIEAKVQTYMPLGGYPVVKYYDEYTPIVRQMNFTNRKMLIKWICKPLHRIDVYLSTDSTVLENLDSDYLVEQLGGYADSQPINSVYLENLTVDDIYYLRLVPFIIYNNEVTQRTPSRIYKISSRIE